MNSSFEKVISQIKVEKDYLLKSRLILSLIKEHDIKTKDLSAKLGIKPSYLCHIKRLNRLPEIVVDGYYSKNITLSHIFIISRLQNKKDMTSVYEKVLTKNLTVLETEDLIRELLHNVKSAGQELAKEEKEALINKIIGKYKNSNVKITQTRIKSKLLIEIKGSLEKTTPILRSLLEKI